MQTNRNESSFTAAAKQAFITVATEVIAAIAVVGERGMPADLLVLSLQSALDMPFSVAMDMMAMLQDAGMVVQRNHCYFLSAETKRKLGR